MIRQYILSGCKFRVSTDEPAEPETANRFVVDIWLEEHPDGVDYYPGAGAWFRVVGIFNNVGEALTAGKREYAAAGYKQFK